jgi:hypothetical protein
MIDSNSRTSRKVAIAEHIWTAFDEMASQMGSERDALINQAMFMFARLNGFMDGSANGSANGASSSGSRPAPAAPPARGPSAAMGRPAGLAARNAENHLDEDPARREVAERVLETAAELERLIKGKNQSSSSANALAEAQEEPSGADPVSAEEDAPEGGALYMMMEGGELDRIAKERFVIGRGKHCDFVINSGKVSREHAQIVRDGVDFFLEDLGSSNGTWFNKQRIKRRKIEDGDEYFICSEKVKFVFR